MQRGASKGKMRLQAEHWWEARNGDLISMHTVSKICNMLLHLFKVLGQGRLCLTLFCVCLLPLLSKPHDQTCNLQQQPCLSRTKVFWSCMPVLSPCISFLF